MPYVVGYPRIGEKRELKFALEKFWSGRSGLDELESVAKELRKRHWLYQKRPVWSIYPATILATTIR